MILKIDLKSKAHVSGSSKVSNIQSNPVSFSVHYISWFFMMSPVQYLLRRSCIANARPLSLASAVWFSDSFKGVTWLLMAPSKIGDCCVGNSLQWQHSFKVSLKHFILCWTMTPPYPSQERVTTSFVDNSIITQFHDFKFNFWNCTYKSAAYGGESHVFFNCNTFLTGNWSSMS